jgi:hypothetical protein
MVGPSVTDLVGRIRKPLPAAVQVAAASGVSAIALAVTRNWEKSRDMLDGKIEDLTTRRHALEAERRDLLLDAVDGDGPARAQVDKLDRTMAVIDADLSRISDARAVAASKAAEERAAAARRDHLAAVSRFDAAIEELERRAADLDRQAADFARATLSLAGAAEQARRLCPGRLPLHPGDHLLGYDRTMTSVRRALRAAGCAWAWSSSEYPPPPSIAASITEGATWARRHLPTDPKGA